MSKRILIA